ncbi:Na+-driven multidrug efflux pump [Clostridium butyricum]|nr:Na+-driven multidrug efflux pump [Clostridium butyricum]
MRLNGVWIAFAADECFRGILMFIRWKLRVWEKKRIIRI